MAIVVSEEEECSVYICQVMRKRVAGSRVNILNKMSSRVRPIADPQLIPDARRPSCNEVFPAGRGSHHRKHQMKGALASRSRVFDQDGSGHGSVALPDF